ncbi:MULTISPECIES: hypothetical protein [Vibrio]|uniref:hypothetical protein n=1 Tax=Vibrio TaxID=662 RepID=UPI0008419CBF|nr:MULTISPECIES: hypothetical protein [Vibrio]ODM56921.1 hypothetical protein BC455_17660 [Vibrio harveyi]USD58450.1 hypothetical protein J4N44_27540 [Vibrio sp. SCSIO 43155]
MKPSIITFCVMFVLVGPILLLPTVTEYERVIGSYLVVTIQGLSVIALFLVALNAFEDLKELINKQHNI